MTSRPDPIFSASTPVPGEDLSSPKRGNMSQAAMPTSPQFWGRKYVAPTPLQVASAFSGPQPYPRMMYHSDGRMQVAEHEEAYKEAVANGWKDTADLVHRELLQFGDGGKSGNKLPTAGSGEKVEEKKLKN